MEATNVQEKKTNKTTVDGIKSEIFYWFRKRGDLTRNIAFPLCLSARKPLSKSGFLRPFSPLILGMYGLWELSQIFVLGARSVSSEGEENATLESECGPFLTLREWFWSSQSSQKIFCYKSEKSAPRVEILMCFRQSSPLSSLPDDILFPAPLIPIDQIV